MATTTTTILTSPGIQEFFSNASKFQVTAASTNGSTVNISQDALNTYPLATLAAGQTATFSSPGGFFYESASVGSVTVTQVGSIAYELVGAGTVVTGTGSGSVVEGITAQYVIPANLLQAGTTIRVRYMVTATQLNTGDSIAPKLHLGSTGTTSDTAILTQAAGTVTTANLNAIGEMVLVVQAAPGGSVAIVGNGWYVNYGATGGSVLSNYLNSTTFATNAPLYLTLGIVPSSTSASNKSNAQTFEVTIS